MNRVVLIVIGILILAGIVFVILAGDAPTPYTVQEPEDEIDWDWVKDNCDCIEKNKRSCRYEGFELIEGGVCRKAGQITTALISCSKYNCTGEIYEVD
jgi:hypothetical protein